MIYFNIIAAIVILLMIIAMIGVVIVSNTVIEGYSYMLLLAPLISVLIFTCFITAIVNIINSIF